LGKIFNALEKSKKEHKTSALKVHSLPIKDEPKKKPPPLDTQTPQNRVGTVDRNLIALIKPQSFEAEQFKQLRTNLLFPASGKSPQSIMITSAVPGEGKSFVSSNLAISIAQNIDEHVFRTR
jgi:Mrp family chromosome partitioning ATPase